MPRSISTAFLPSRQIATVFVAGLLGLAALLTMLPASASADSPTSCDPGEFCLAYDLDLGGGLYQNKGNDRDLRDNVFLPYTGKRVNANSWSAYNHGTAQSNGLNDVIVYNRPFLEGVGEPGNGSACVTLGRLLPDLLAVNAATGVYENWRNAIMSFRWATHSECVPHGVLVTG